MPDSREFLTADEAARYVRVTSRTIRSYIHAGRLPAAKVGKSYLIALGDLLALFAPTTRPVAVHARATPAQREARQVARAGVRA